MKYKICIRNIENQFEIKFYKNNAPKAVRYRFIKRLN